jgi:hypothetical protein
MDHQHQIASEDHNICPNKSCFLSLKENVDRVIQILDTVLTEWENGADVNGYTNGTTDTNGSSDSIGDK